MTNRLNTLYDILIDIKERIEDAKIKNAIEMKTLSIYN